MQSRMSSFSATDRRLAGLTRRALLTAGAGAVFVATTGIGSFEALFAPSAKLWPRWQTQDRTSTATIDHSAWNKLLSAYVKPGRDGVARFDYRRVSASDRQALDAYLADLSATRIGTFNRAEQFAYWVNLYNALTVKVILDHFPVDSIRDIDISSGVLSDGPWGAELISVEGQRLTLNDIEHRILRPIWRDPRIHYAVNCASIGCPDLQRQAFTGANHQRLMDSAARTYINHPRGVTVDANGVTVSSIYAWFEEDFGNSDRTVLEHLRRYANRDLAAKLEGKTTIDGYRYDWALNGA